MNTETIIAELEQANRWRRDNDGTEPMPNPTRLGEAIDAAVAGLRESESVKEFFGGLLKKADAERDAAREELATMRAQSIALVRERDAACKERDEASARLLEVIQREATERADASKARQIINAALHAAPVGDVRQHTAENLPAIIADLAQQVGECCAEADAQRADTARLDWLENREPDAALWDYVADAINIRDAIDAAMKGGSND